MKSKGVFQILIAFVLLLLLSALAWGFGWTARVVFNRINRAVPDPTPAPTLTVAVPVVPTLTPTLPTVERVTPPAVLSPTTLAPTSTPRPTQVASPTPNTYQVKYGDWLAGIAGKVCPNLHTYSEREKFGQQILTYNGLQRLQPGQVLSIPPCPENY